MLLSLLITDIIPQALPVPPVGQDLGLITLTEAKTHLRIYDDYYDTDLFLKGTAASEIILDYLKQLDSDWTPETTPFKVKAATLLVLGALFEDREGGDPISPAVKSLLMRLRDPAYA
jgi:hypothetical protein